MGKKNKGTYLGRTLIKDRFGPRKIRRDDSDSMVCTFLVISLTRDLFLDL